MSDRVSQCGEDMLEHTVSEFDHGDAEFGLHRVTEESMAEHRVAQNVNVNTTTTQRVNNTTEKI